MTKAGNGLGLCRRCGEYWWWWATPRPALRPECGRGWVLARQEASESGDGGRRGQGRQGVRRSTRIGRGASRSLAYSSSLADRQGRRALFVLGRAATPPRRLLFF